VIEIRSCQSPINDPNDAKAGLYSIKYKKPPGKAARVVELKLKRKKV
jgi:hypothetical protein